MSRELSRRDPARIRGMVAGMVEIYTQHWAFEAQEDFEFLVALAEKGIGAEALVRVLEDNLSSIDAERTALSPSARGALGAILKVLKEVESGGNLAARKEAAAAGRLAEREGAFPGAEASEVKAALEEERGQYETLRVAAQEFLDNLHHPQIGVQSTKESNLRALVNKEANKEIEATL